MLERFTRRYCDCEEWQQAKCGEKELLLKQYPGQCPYCHTKLKSESRTSEVRILFAFSTSHPFDEPIDLSLAELKELLKEV